MAYEVTVQVDVRGLGMQLRDNGNLYVTELGASRITLLRPRP